MGASAGISAITKETYIAVIARQAKKLEYDPNIEGIDIDRAWHAIHYLLTGDARLTFLLSGTQIWAVDISEHSEVHGADSLRALWERYQYKSVDEILVGYQPEVFNQLGIYPLAPHGWKREDELYIRQHLEHFLLMLRQIVDRDSCMHVYLF